MSDSVHDEQFTSWRQALAEGQLTASQLEILEEMVRQGQAPSPEAAADICDWRENIQNPDEHMWGS